MDTIILKHVVFYGGSQRTGIHCLWSSITWTELFRLCWLSLSVYLYDINFIITNIQVISVSCFIQDHNNRLQICHICYWIITELLFILSQKALDFGLFENIQVHQASVHMILPEGYKRCNNRKCTQAFSGPQCLKVTSCGWWSIQKQSVLFYKSNP